MTFVAWSENKLKILMTKIYHAINYFRLNIQTQSQMRVIIYFISDVKYDRITSCHECRERLKPPVVLLPCNHNLCQVCCQKIFDNKSLPIKNSRNGGRRIRCPACRYEVVLDMHGVHSLPRTRFILNKNFLILLPGWVKYL